MKYVLWFSFLISTAFYITTSILDPDLWWHITSGKWILAHHSVPKVDYWTMYASGKPWIAYSWPHEILYALIDKHFGIKGLLVLKWFLAVSIVFSFFFVFGKISNNWALGALVGALCSAEVSFNFTLRPQSFAWILFAFLLLTVDKINKEGINRKLMLALFALLCIWANTHITTSFALITIFCILFDPSYYLLSVICVFSGLAGTLLTPYFGKEWLAFYQHLNAPLSFNIISEFRAANIGQYDTGVVLIIALLAVFLLTVSHKSVKILEVAWGLGLLLVGLYIVKFLPFASIYLSYLIAKLWRDVSSIEKGLIEGIKKLLATIDKIPKEGLSFLLICTAIVNGYKAWQAPLNTVIIPKDAVDFIIKKQLPYPIISRFGYGGYLMYRFSKKDGSPIYKVSIDGRTNLIGKKRWTKYLNFVSGAPKWYEYLEEVNPKTIFWDLNSPVSSLFVLNKKWCLIYSESITSLYSKAVFVKKALAKKLSLSPPYPVCTLDDFKENIEKN